MSWKRLLAERKVRAHATSKKELDALRAVIKRDLADASIKGIGDRRFATAYNAALQIAKMAIACAGYRLATTPGHHRLTLDAARLALGSSSAHSLDFFESCRRKRNAIDYDHASVATHIPLVSRTCESRDRDRRRRARNGGTRTAHLIHSFIQELPKKAASVGYSNDSSNASPAHKPAGV